MIEYSGLANSPWVSEPILLRSFLDKCRDKLPSVVKGIPKAFKSFTVKDITPIMGTDLTNKQFSELLDYCSEDKLSVSMEPPMLSTKTVMRKHKYFSRSVAMCKDCELETCKKSLRGTHSEHNSFLKYKNTVLLRQEPGLHHGFKPNDELVITIRVHNTTSSRATPSIPVKPMSQEITVLGRQTLDKLRDKIFCPIDYTTASTKTATLSERTTNPLRAKDVFKSGFLFIEDVFYNDLRCELNIDYSEVVMEWAKYKKMGPMKTGSLTETQFQDLTVRMGFPYVFVHQGNCEHLLVFSDVSLIHASDVRNCFRYPLYKSLGLLKQHMCMICNVTRARWITFENPRVPADPFYFCDRCFKSYNFVDGKQVGDFKYYEIFPYMPINFFTGDEHC